MGNNLLQLTKPHLHHLPSLPRPTITRHPARHPLTTPPTLARPLTPLLHRAQAQAQAPVLHQVQLLLHRADRTTLLPWPKLSSTWARWFLLASVTELSCIYLNEARLLRRKFLLCYRFCLGLLLMSSVDRVRLFTFEHSSFIHDFESVHLQYFLRIPVRILFDFI